MSPAPRTFDESALVSVLERARSLGFLGERPIDEAIAHARIVVEALSDVSGRVVDLGSGGGLPGLVVVHDRPDLEVTLVDRRTKRSDVLERVVRRHDLAGRVTVRGCDVAVLGDEVATGTAAAFDAAVARGFGPPAVTLAAMVSVVRPGGRLVVTEPPVGDRWDPDVLTDLGVARVDGPSGVAIFVR